MQGPAEKQNPESMIGKTIVVKGEIIASAPLYVYGRIEGSINAPEQRVTIAKEGKVKASVSAREIVVMGDARGKLDGSSRVEIRSDGSLTGDLVTERISIEEGAILKGTIHVRTPKEADRVEARKEPEAAREPQEAEDPVEAEFDGEELEATAVS
ncbi:MAG TPA: polymer-forming cytoskeletal protein [Terracidiphilus sp.]|nr:polymer-forming cytoskeletal protein [Terracidiphilus sp.]